jgi:hypothetical protein
MQSSTHPCFRVRLTTNALLSRLAITGFATLTLAPAARAQDASTGNSIAPALRYAGGLLSVGGYYFTGGTAARAIGTPKFYGDSQLFVHPKNLGVVTLTGGLEIMSANDHLLPFQGGNEYQMIGPAGRISIPRVVGRLRPFVTGGLFYGRLRSVQRGFDRSDFVPSLSAGVEFPFARYVTLYTSYRISKEIHGVNTDGVSIGLKVF